MRWLILGVGVIGGIIGARLTEAGEDVSFLVRREEVRTALCNHGLTIITHRTGQRHTLPIKVVAPGDPLTSFDVVLIALRRDAVDEHLADSLAPAMGSQTLVVTMFSTFGLLPALVERFSKQCRVIGYPTGIGGWHGASETEIVAVVPRLGMNIALGHLPQGHRDDVNFIASAFRRAGMRVWIFRDVMSYSRLAAALIVAVAKGTVKEQRTLRSALSDNAATDRIIGELDRIIKLLRKSNLKVPLFARVALRAPAVIRRLCLRLPLRGSTEVEGFERYLAAGGRAEADALAQDLREIESKTS